MREHYMWVYMTFKPEAIGEWGQSSSDISVNFNQDIFDESISTVSISACMCLTSQGHGSDEEDLVRRREGGVSGRGPAGFSPTGDPDQPGLGAGLGGEYQGSITVIRNDWASSSD